jgi:hypothetical protein
MRGNISAIVVLLLAVVGCTPSPYLRLPQLHHRPMDVEERANEFHDPFPDSLSGPGISNRPRGFGRPRTATRKAANLRGVHLLDPRERLPESRKKLTRRNHHAVVTN